MSEVAIQINNLHFGYSPKENILKELNLTVPEGAIYGFLGRNGAGKSTALRNILGLLKPQKGNISILGKGSVAIDRSLYKEIGSLIESPSLYNHLNAKQNLNIACELRGVSRKRVYKVLEDVGLENTKGKKVGSFSMGMKQRLGLAIALIHDPSLLILDEPTNGLDPQGIQEMRSVLKNLQSQGKTIILSSHLLSEIEKIASHIGILNGGKLVFEGSIEDLNELKATESVAILKCSNVAKVDSLLGNIAEIIDKNHIKVKGQGTRFIPELIKLLCEDGVDIYEVVDEKTTLEQLFMHITKR